MRMMVINAKTCSHVQHRGSHFCKYLQGGGAKWKSSRKKVAACAKNLLQKLFEFAPFINCMIWKCSVLKANYGYLSVNWENRSLKMGVRSDYSSNIEEEENIRIQIIRLSDHMSDYQITFQIIRSDFIGLSPSSNIFRLWLLCTSGADSRGRWGNVSHYSLLNKDTLWTRIHLKRIMKLISE